MADRVPVAYPPLPLGQFGFLLQLQQTGDVDHLAEDQAQADGTGGNVGLGPGVGETTGQQRQVETLLRIGDELAQLVKVAVIHR